MSATWPTCTSATLRWILVGAIALAVGGLMYPFGNPHAGRTLSGVAVGLPLILVAPSIVA